MATLTKNYGFTKPDGSDQADISVLNTDFDLIDEELKKKEDADTALGKKIDTINETLPKKVDKEDGKALLPNTDKELYDKHLADKANPHGVTKEQVGLGNADNTSDADKPVSTAQQTGLDKKVDKVAGSSLLPDTAKKSYDEHLASKANPHGVTKAQVGLGNVDNTSDADKPVSKAQKTAIDTVATTAATNLAALGLTVLNGQLCAVYEG